MDVIRHSPDGQQLLPFAAVQGFRRKTAPPAQLRRAKWHRTSPHSREAARRAEPRHGTRKARILDYVREQNTRGATRDEIAIGLDLGIQSVCSPVRAMLDDRLLLETAQTRPTRHGSPAAVLVAHDAYDMEARE